MRSYNCLKKKKYSQFADESSKGPNAMLHTAPPLPIYAFVGSATDARFPPQVSQLCNGVKGRLYGNGKNLLVCSFP